MKHTCRPKVMLLTLHPIRQSSTPQRTTAHLVFLLSLLCCVVSSWPPNDRRTNFLLFHPIRETLSNVIIPTSFLPKFTILSPIQNFQILYSNIISHILSFTKFTEILGASEREKKTLNQCIREGCLQQPEDFTADPLKSLKDSFKTASTSRS